MRIKTILLSIIFHFYKKLFAKNLSNEAVQKKNRQTSENDEDKGIKSVLGLQGYLVEKTSGKCLFSILEQWMATNCLFRINMHY